MSPSPPSLKLMGASCWWKNRLRMVFGSTTRWAPPDPGDSSPGLVREALEETAYAFGPVSLIGNLYVPANSNNGTDHNLSALCFLRNLGAFHPDRSLDTGIVRTLWMTYMKKSRPAPPSPQSHAPARRARLPEWSALPLEYSRAFQHSGSAHKIAVCANNGWWVSAEE